MNIEKIEAQIYKIKEDKFTISFKNSNNKYSDQIGTFNEKMIFIPEYLLMLYDYNNLNNFIANAFKYFEQNKNNNYYESQPDYCFKIIDENSKENMNQKDDFEDILSLQRNKQLKFNSYSCINCEAEIELTAINICNDKEEDIIQFKCCGKCEKIISLPLKDYLNKMIRNTYLSKKCCVCGNIQMDDKNNIFKKCILCNKIFCNDNLCLLLHKCEIGKLIQITEYKYICLEHSDNNNKYKIKYYCKDHNKHLCENCMKEGIHNYDNIESIILYQPIEINNIKEEDIIFNNIILYLKNKQKEISNNKKNKLRAEQKIKEEKIINEYNEPIKNYNKSERSEKNINEENYKKNIKNTKEEFYKKITEQIKNYYDTMSMKLYDINNNNQIDDGNFNVDNKYAFAQNFFAENNKIEIENKNIIDSLKKNYDEKIKNFEITYINEKNKIEKIYGNKREERRKIKERKITKLKDNYNQKIDYIDIEYDDPQKNKLEYQIVFSNIILNAYKLEPNSNYFFTKNFYNLMGNFYNNVNIFNNVVRIQINRHIRNLEIKEKISNAIEKKKTIL